MIFNQKYKNTNKVTWIKNIQQIGNNFYKNLFNLKQNNNNLLKFKNKRRFINICDPFCRN